MPRLALVLALLAGAVARADAAVYGDQPDVIGQAFSPGSDNLLYLEQHYCNDTSSHCRVLYVDTGGEIFASKDIEYSAAPNAPGLHFQDFRSDMELRLPPSSDPDLVVDAGFDNYVRLRWTELADGKSIRFPFLVAGRDSPLAMRAGPDEDEACDPDAVCLQIELDSWLLGMLVDPIELIYDRGSQRLMRFRGISNLKDGDGGSQVVDIRYQYPGDEQQ